LPGLWDASQTHKTASWNHQRAMDPADLTTEKTPLKDMWWDRERGNQSMVGYVAHVHCVWRIPSDRRCCVCEDPSHSGDGDAEEPKVAWRGDGDCRLGISGERSTRRMMTGLHSQAEGQSVPKSYMMRAAEARAGEATRGMLDHNTRQDGTQRGLNEWLLCRRRRGGFHGAGLWDLVFPELRSWRWWLGRDGRLQSACSGSCPSFCLPLPSPSLCVSAGRQIWLDAARQKRW
jgi:hypothetical protein